MSGNIHPQGQMKNSQKYFSDETPFMLFDIKVLSEFRASSHLDTFGAS